MRVMQASSSNHDLPIVAMELGKDAAAGGHRLTILNGIELTVERGEPIAITGESGAGKSTLISLLAGLDVPDRGHVQLLGENLAELDEDGRARLRAGRVGFVFQSFQLISSMTALENVMLPLQLAGAGDARATALEALQRVRLEARLAHHPHQLSGGEQQRVALARAFCIRPMVLFADEPTGNLDNNTGRQVEELMFALNCEAGTTLVLVTHETGLASRCARCIRLHGGRMYSGSMA